MKSLRPALFLAMIALMPAAHSSACSGDCRMGDGPQDVAADITTSPSAQCTSDAPPKVDSMEAFMAALATGSNTSASEVDTLGQ